MLEKDLDIYDVWESVNGNLFIKLTEEDSIGIGAVGEHAPNEYDFGKSQFIKADNVSEVKKVGKLILF